MIPKIVVVTSSPAGSTQKVANCIAEVFAGKQADVQILDMSAKESRVRVDQALEAGPACLFIGSPVYRDVAVPPVMDFIDGLPQGAGAWAVPFVTYGGACSGVALWQMAEALNNKGYRVAGAAKVIAVHSLMWTAKEPAGFGHPDENDLQEVRILAEKLAERFDSGNMSSISMDALDYHPAESTREMRAKIGAPWMIVPKKVDNEACTQCGVCEENCPVSAVTLNPYPEFTDRCFDCFNCIRLCPEDAIAPAKSLEAIHQYIQSRVDTVKERPYTRIFI